MISRYSVKKPFTVLVAVILIIVLGVVSVTKMTPDLLPEMSFPYIVLFPTHKTFILPYPEYIVVPRYNLLFLYVFFLDVMSEQPRRKWSRR